MVADKVQDASAHLENRRIIGIAKAGCGCRYLREHAPEVRRRTRNRR
jgi:hypothetical protein